MELHKLIFKGVEGIINSNDPVGLVEGGAPDDEYHTEIGKIVTFLRTESDKEALADKIQNTFEESFNSDMKKDRNLYLKISEELLDLKKRLRW